ncbi:MAG TPA: hypothetical protein VNA17_02910 [Pyrinomonadaceae bacterium]|nr:hypothetical protein [Pyrinomonadaceae bacterium]
MIIAKSTIRSISGLALLSLMAGALLYVFSQPGLIKAVQAQVVSEESEQSAGFRCSNRTLRGRYAVRGEGWVPSGPPGTPMVPFANVSLMTLDGQGSLINDITVSRNGQISRNIDNGTYSVGENCKGTMTVNIPTPPFQLTFDLVVADAGEDFYFIATTLSVVNHEAHRLK